MTFPPSPPPSAYVKRVLCVCAHPDDVDFGCAGTIARWVDDGLAVAYLVVTRGEAGGNDPAVVRESIPGIREAEQRAAARAVGVEVVEFLDGYRDGTVTPSLDLRRDIAGAIRRHRPDRVVTNAPLRRWDRIAGPSHPDHLAVGEAVTCAVYPDARNPFAYDELRGLPPWTVGEVWYFGGPSPDHMVHITATFARKLAALRAHESQTAHHEDLAALIRQRHESYARAAGLPADALAEAYTVIRTA